MLIYLFIYFNAERCILLANMRITCATEKQNLHHIAIMSLHLFSVENKNQQQQTTRIVFQEALPSVRFIVAS